MFNFFVILAFVARFLLMPISAHSDLFFINAYPNLLINQGIIDISSYINKHVSENISYYPPLTYFSFATFQYFYQSFSSTFSSWMSNITLLFEVGFTGQAADFIEAAPNTHLYRDLFLAKIPYLIFDLAAVVIILKAVKNRLLKKASILIWLFNPVSLYGIYMMGQFEIIPDFFVLVGFLALRKNAHLGIFLLGIAAAFKNYAFLFIIPTILVYESSWRGRAKLFAIAASPYLIFLLPTIISNAKGAIYAFFPKVYLAYRKPLEGWPLYSQIIKYSVLAFTLAITLAISSVLKLKDKWKAAIGASLAAVLLVFALAPRISFHYLLWATPLIILWFGNTKVVTFIILVQALSLASYKLLANHLQAGLFVPLNPNLSQLPTVNSIIDQVIPYGFISSFGFFIFFLLNLFLAAKIILDLLFKEPISGQDLKA